MSNQENRKGEVIASGNHWITVCRILVFVLLIPLIFGAVDLSEYEKLTDGAFRTAVSLVFIGVLGEIGLFFSLRTYVEKIEVTAGFLIVTFSNYFYFRKLVVNKSEVVRITITSEAYQRIAFHLRNGETIKILTEGLRFPLDLKLDPGSSQRDISYRSKVINGIAYKISTLLGVPFSSEGTK